MSVRNLGKVFAPERIAVIGAGPAPDSVGGIVLANLTAGSYEGIVHAVNPAHEAVHGIECHPSVSALPGAPDLAVIATPAATVPGLVRECGEAGVGAVIVVAAGFRESGPDGAARERELAAAAADFPGLRIVGPNCLGVMVPALGLNASFARVRPRAGHVALISQSGALVTAVLDWAELRSVGFSAVVSAGNMVDVDVGDLLDHFAQDRQTRAVILYVESITDARKFMSAARAFSHAKPIVAIKTGRYAGSAQAAVSHTGAMAGADAVYAAAFRRAGVERVPALGEVFDVAALLGAARRPRGRRLAIVTNAGGPGVMAADALIERGGELAQLGEEAIAALDAALPAQWSHGNPVDVLGDAAPDRFDAATRAVLADPGVDAALVALTPQAMTDPAGAGEAVGRVAREARKPVLAAWMGGAAVAEGRRRLEAAGVPTYGTPEWAVSGFMHLVAHARNLETLYATPRTMPVQFDLDRDRVHELVSGVLWDNPGDTLSEARSKALLGAYGIPVTRPVPARTAEEAVEAAERVGPPVVMKVNSPDVTHKTDVDGVQVGLSTRAEIRAAFDRIERGLAERAPDARFAGVTLQPMVTGPGVELVLGARKDPTFGAVIAAGAGGVTAELLGDVTLELPPLDERLARGMLERLRIWPLLTGFRGRPAVDVERLVEILVRLSYLVADWPEIAELDINPLFAGRDEVIALDARVIVDADALHRPPPRYAHLAIRPYPEELGTDAQLSDGQPVRLRPIRPEDEPLWHEMLAASSQDTIRSRFRSLFRETTHRMGIRYCMIDYDREMAIVAVVEEDGSPRMAGVGRLVCEAEGDVAEYAILIADPWQGRGLSALLTARCLEIARGWELRRVWAETDADNRRMIAVLRRFGFAMQHEPGEGLVLGTLDLSPPGRSRRRASATPGR